MTPQEEALLELEDFILHENQPSRRDAWLAALKHARTADPLMAEAFALTTGDRNAAYGDVHEVFQNYAHIWTGLLGSKLKDGEVITATDVCILMTGLKLGREAHGQGKRDTVVDAHGYLSLLSRLRKWF